MGRTRANVPQRVRRRIIRRACHDFLRSTTLVLSVPMFANGRYVNGKRGNVSFWSQVHPLIGVPKFEDYEIFKLMDYTAANVLLPGPF